MQLQRIIMSKIDDFCGINTLTNVLEYHVRNPKNQHKEVFEDLIIYYNNFYTSEFPVIHHAVTYRESIMVGVSIFKEYAKIQPCKTCDFIVDLVMFKLDYIDSVRSLN